MPGAFKYVSDREAAERHQEKTLKAKPLRGGRPEIARLPEVRNIEPILALGDVRYFGFHHHVIGVKPLPFKVGQRIVDLQARTIALGKVVAEKGDQKVMKEYFRHLDRLKKLLWSQSFKTGKFIRFLRRIGLARNPFQQATELELLEMSDFFLKGRMKSNVRFSLASLADQ